MTVVRISDYQVRFLKSYWFGNTQVRCRAREIGKRQKIMIDLFVLRPEKEPELQTSELVKLANKVAEKMRVMSFDKTWIRDFSCDRKGADTEGVTHLTHVREITLAYQGY